MPSRGHQHIITENRTSAGSAERKEGSMPEQKTIERARKKAREGRSPSTQAGGFVREEMDHIRQGKHGARSTKQAIAIGLSKARKAGVALPARGKNGSTGKTHRPQNRPSARRSQAILEVLKREPRSVASHQALSAQAHRVARQRGPVARHQAAMKAVGTKGPKMLREEARKAARTRKGNVKT
jgi:hypothetical protein